MEAEIKKYERKNYYYSLALESYEDHTGIKSDKIHDTWAKLANYRENKDSLEINERIDIAKKISEEFESEIETAGKEKFDIYDDGYALYKWEDIKENE